MSTHTVKIKDTLALTPNVYRIRTEKPKGFDFSPGQATEVSLLKDGFKDQKRPFTFTSLPEDDFLEFSIKSYPSHNGVTEQIPQLKAGEYLEIGEAWGNIQYHDEGVFLAGGAGVTPFISIFKMLQRDHKIGSNSLIFSNKKAEDVILESYWRSLLGKHFTSILTQDEATGHEKGRVDREFLDRVIPNKNQHFYICGPDAMVVELKNHLIDLGVSQHKIILEA